MTKRHPDPHTAIGQVLQDARDALGPTIPPRDDRFALLPEDDDDDAIMRLVLLAFGCGAAAAIVVIAVFETVVL